MEIATTHHKHSAAATVVSDVLMTPCRLSVINLRLAQILYSV